jgi:hypothetical protein
MKLFYVKINEEDFIALSYNHIIIEDWAKEQNPEATIIIENYNPNNSMHIVAYDEDGVKVI